MQTLVDPAWLPPAPKGGLLRVITHWTGGRYRPSEDDLRHYHFLIDGEGRVVKGDYSVLDNLSAADGTYAEHTRGCNTGSIGIAVCCMRDARERPFHAGPCPMTELQWDRMAMAVAEICFAYEILVGPRTVLAHGEVQGNLGIVQAGKWDPLARPWLAKPLEGAGEDFRARVRLALRVAASEAPR